MPAKNLFRVDEEGIYSHIYNKGIEQRVIFNDKEDYEVFLSYLKDYLIAPRDPDSVKKVFKVHGRTFRGTPHQPKNYFNKVELIAYSLMPNHFHLLLHQKTRGSLENFIKSLCTRYSMNYNKKYQRTGALFEGPYKSITIQGNENFLPYLTRFLHHTDGYSSYPEYLGKRSTPWVKSQAILALFKMNTDAYKYFMEEHKYDQREKEFIDGIIFNNDTECLESRDLASSGDLHLNPGLKSRPKVFGFMAASILALLLLTTLGIRNIQISAVRSPQSLPAPQVLSETEEVKPTEVIKPKVILTVKIDDASASSSAYVNIREEPSTDSAKLGKARDGDAFEFVSKDQGWYEVRLDNGLTGFISEKYIIEKGANN
ncbi:MAG: hypothetical protein A2868_01860 [Candidatus Levybacteria bacterium RIFCSPHIGHO2_01_FULL_40_15b]|nr:MAG: hypothetical protein A2868_01860 [Candidatus Levybacteria bacterium RIFCSPHIGHO2_01_FULL_40_15b]